MRIKMNLNRKNRNGATSIIALGGLILVFLIGGAAYWWINRDGGNSTDEPILHTVERGPFVAQVLDQGEVQSSDNKEIRCNVRARNGAVKVIKVVPEGTQVEPGDFLVKLDSQSFEKERDTQKLAVTNAETAVQQATATLAAAEKSWDEYREGTFEQEKLLIQNELFAAEQEVEQAKANLEHTQTLYKKGFTTAQILRSNEIALAKGRNAVKMAEKKLEVLEKITYKKNEIIFNSDIKAAETQLENSKEELALQEKQLAEIQAMITACEITTPEGVSGEVVFAKESSWRGDDWILEEGAEVRENQVLIRIPDPNKMEFKALINEQSITSIEEGMPAEVKVDALNSKTTSKLKGRVTKVNQYAENTGRWGGNIRKYAVFVKIMDPPDDLIPGMNGSATIQTMYSDDVVQIPIQSIYAVNDQRFVLMKQGDQWKTQEVKIKGDNSQYAWVTDGVVEGDVVALNPGAFRDWMDLPPVDTDRNLEDDPNRDPTNYGQGQSGENQRTSGGGRDRGEGRGREGRSGGSRGMGDPSAMIDGMMKRYDSNSDGKIDKDELGKLSDQAKGFVGRADSNGDGEITKEEMKSAMEKMMRQGGGQRGGGGRQ